MNTEKKFEFIMRNLSKSEMMTVMFWLAIRLAGQEDDDLAFDEIIEEANVHREQAGKSKLSFDEK